MKYFLRVEDDEFTFVVDSIHKIRDNDILITEEEYKEFFKIQSSGKKFRLKQSRVGESLFDHVESYSMEPTKDFAISEKELKSMQDTIDILVLSSLSS